MGFAFLNQNHIAGKFRNRQQDRSYKVRPSGHSQTAPNMHSAILQLCVIAAAVFAAEGLKPHIVFIMAGESLPLITVSHSI
jgi:hypothetical protein